MELLFKSLEEGLPNEYYLKVKLNGIEMESTSCYTKTELKEAFGLKDEVIEQLIKTDD